LTVKKGKMQVAVPLIGFKQYPSEAVQGEIEREILEDENVVPRDFYIPSIPEISAAGRLRTVLTPITDLSVEKASRDSASPPKRKIRLSFKDNEVCLDYLYVSRTIEVDV